MEHTQATRVGGANSSLVGPKINISGLEKHKLNIIFAYVRNPSICKFQGIFQVNVTVLLWASCHPTGDQDLRVASEVWLIQSA